MDKEGCRVSLGKRLRFCPAFDSLGVFPNWDDYPPKAGAAIRSAEGLYYPSALYEDLGLSVGKSVFPRNYYRFMGHKIRQTNLFQLLGIPHPRTRFYYGRDRSARICREFVYPFVAKTPIGSSKGEGVYLIRCAADLARYLEKHRPAYIQEYLPIDRDLRVVLLAGKVIHAYWRVRRPGEFRNNIAQGASIDYEAVPEDGLEFAREVVRLCRFDEVGLDICYAHDRYYVLEANMVYGLEGFRQAGLNIYEILARLGEDGSL